MRSNDIAADFDFSCIAPAAPIKTRRLQRKRQQRMRGVEILGMKEVQSITENARFMILFDAEPLARVDGAETRG